MLYQILYYLWGFSTLNERRKRRKSIIVCTKCEAEWQNGTRFCGKCGNRTLVSVPDFEKLEDKRYKERQQQTSLVMLRNSARQRIAALKKATFCPACSTYFEPALSYCSQCGCDVSNQLLTDESIFQIIQPEFTQLISTLDDYLALSQTKQESLGSMKEVAVDFYKWWRR